MTIWKLVIGVVVGGCLLLLIAAILIPTSGTAYELDNRAVCMSNLRSINSAIIIYKGENNDAWPWLYDTMTEWDTTAVGTNRNVSPFGENDDPNYSQRRSITSLMFMLVRSGQAPGIFRCPDDKNAVPHRNVKAGADDGDVLEGDFYWDFSRPENVSYSWQAPIWKDGRFVQGIDRDEPDTVVCADMTPAATRPGWKPANVSKLDGTAIEAQNSPNHQGKQNNVLMAGGSVKALKRPDVGADKDNIYTASGDPNAGSPSATSLDIRRHLSPRDTFLIGPVGRKAE